MDKRVLNILKIIGLCLLLYLVFGFFISVFITGPNGNYKSIDQKINRTMMEKNKISNCKVVSLFADLETYYVSLCNNNVEEYVFFNEEGTVLARRNIQTYEDGWIKEKLNNYQDIEIKLGFYKGKVAYIAYNDEIEIIYSYDTKEELRNWKKR